VFALSVTSAGTALLANEGHCDWREDTKEADAYLAKMLYISWTQSVQMMLVGNTPGAGGLWKKPRTSCRVTGPVTVSILVIVSVRQKALVLVSARQSILRIIG